MPDLILLLGPKSNKIQYNLASLFINAYSYYHLYGLEPFIKHDAVGLSSFGSGETGELATVI